MTQLAHSRGMRVFWKPTVNCLDGTWRARISFFDHDVPCETKWSGWFASYQAFQMHFAALAQNEGIANAQPICAGPLRRQVRVPASRQQPLPGAIKSGRLSAAHKRAAGGRSFFARPCKKAPERSFQGFRGARAVPGV